MLEDEEEFSDFKLTEIDLKDQQAKHVIFRNGIMVRVSLIRTVLKHGKMTNVQLEECDLSNGEWAQSKLNRTAINNSKLTGFKLLEGQLNDISIEDCIGDIIQLFGSNLQNVVFSNCRLRKADFRSCQFKDVFFSNCDLTEAEFFEAKFNKVDFSGSCLHGIKAGVNDLRGAIIDTSQAIEMAKHLASLLGIRVKDDT